MLDLRKLFDRHRIFWRDHGANVSHGNIVISCPWCNKTTDVDHGEHLAISTIGEYYCFRNPKHKGMDLSWLFKTLKIPYEAYKDQKITVAKREYKADTKDYTGYQYFIKGEDSREAQEYLSRRLFSRPVEVCQKFNLRVAENGNWAGRLLIPLTIGWTGRSMRSHIEPRYLSETSMDGFFSHSSLSTSCIIIEGAIDAMRIATVSSQFDVIGKCGNRLSPALLVYLREKNYSTVYNAPDGTVPYVQYGEETKTIRSYCTKTQVKHLSLPEDVKDFGEMSESSAREVLWSVSL